jgi:septal ring factor EnvC (AmiA/AmiB activator)
VIVRRRVLAGALVLTFGLGCVAEGAEEGVAPAGGTGTSPAALERLQQEVDARRARLEAFARQEQGLLDTLDGIDRSAARVTRDVALARSEAREAEARLAAAETKARSLAEESAATKQALAARLVTLYREGKAGPLRVLAGAQSLRDLLARARALRHAVEQDAGLLASAKAGREAAAKARVEAEASARASAEAMRRLDERARSLALERESKHEVLAGLRSDGARERSALAELEAAAKALEETLVRLGAIARRPPSALPAIPFTSLRGRLKAPVAAPVARGFGRVVDAEFRTAIFRKGIDFAAPAGATVRAVAPGEVRFAGWFRGYGKMVIVDHGEGYFTVSAHLDDVQVAPGDAVLTDQPVGTVGDTGSLAGPLLYFEIRRGSEPVDPSRWLAGGTGLE